MSLKSEIVSCLQEADVEVNKRLGQNFLVSESALREIVETADLKSEDFVLEIGGGTGVLTNELLKSKAKVFTVERDRRLAEVLIKRFESEIKNKQLVVIQNDFLKLPFPQFFRELGFKEKNYKVVSNLPYQITSPVLETILERDFLPSLAVLTIQKEVAKRICAEPGKMSSISVIIQSVSKPKILSHFPPSHFFPPPEVDSSLLKLENISYPDSDIKRLRKIVRAGFAFKRKMLKNNLATLIQGDEAKILRMFNKLSISPGARAQDLSVQDWQRINKMLDI